MSIRVLVNNPIDEDSLAKLATMEGVEIRIAPDPEKEEPPILPADMLKETEIFFTTFLPEDPQAMENLKLIQIGSAGYSQLLDARLPERGIRACNGSGIFDTAIAEWNLAMMVNLLRNFRLMLRHQNEGKWDRSGDFQCSLRGRTVGFWGYGGLARETARLCKAVGMKVHVLTRDGVKPRRSHYTVPGTGDPDGVIPKRAFTESQTRSFLSNLDFLIMALPLNGSTEGIVGSVELQQLPPRAFLLNPARGPLVQEEALLAALKEGWIAGAALDTHYHYPMPPDHPLWYFDNVIMTPHISGSGEGEYFLPRLWNLFLQNLQSFLHDRPLLNELSKEALNMR